MCIVHAQFPYACLYFPWSGHGVFSLLLILSCLLFIVISHPSSQSLPNDILAPDLIMGNKCAVRRSSDMQFNFNSPLYVD